MGSSARLSRNGDAGRFDVRAGAIYSLRMDSFSAMMPTASRARAMVCVAASLVFVGLTVLAAPVRAGDAPVVRVQEALRDVPAETAEDAIARRNALLDTLFERLASAEDERTAQLLEEAVWQIWLRSGSDTIDVLIQQAVKAIGDQKPAVALDVLDAVVALAPDYAEGWNKRATVLYMLNRYGEAMRDIARVLELEPRHFGALSGIGLIQRALGDETKALAAFRQALSIHPFLKGARQAIEDLSKDVEGQGI